MRVSDVDEYRVSVELSRDDLNILEAALHFGREGAEPGSRYLKMLDNIRALQTLLKAHNEGFPG